MDNYSSSRWNTTLDLSAWSEEYSKRVVINSVITVLFLRIGIIGNLLVILVYSFRMKKIMTDRYFIPILAGLDLLSICFAASLNLSRNVRQFTFPGSTTCKVFIYMAYVFSYSSLNMLLIIAVHRFQKVCRPFKTQMSIFWKRLATVICIIVSAIFHIPILLFYGTITIKHHTAEIYGSQCNKLRDSKTSHSLKIHQPFDIVYNAGLILSITVLYCLIGRTIYRKTNLSKPHQIEHDADFHKNTCEGKTTKSTLHSTELHTAGKKSIPGVDSPKEIIESASSTCGDSTTEDGRSNCKADEHQHHTKIGKKIRGHFHIYRFSYMFMLISFLALLSYIPPIVLILLESRNDNFWNNMSQNKLLLLLFLRRLYMLNNFVNPFVYGCFDTAFKKELKKMCLSLSFLRLNF
ncbi:cholecystokinin receptor type A-like [Mytilus californianus]|uniref:cholecystokinin receptor type A-like n=1 Tax=Mytilus californianus TaxID=6549 RepID=UPI0022463780|nr:cholecystokinin receptor type A-like [Mytilus californianus]